MARFHPVVPSGNRLVRLALVATSLALLPGCPPPDPKTPAGITGGGGQVIPGTRWTNTTRLNTPSNPVENVDVRCCLTLNDDATLTEQCRFTNRSGQALRFIYCDMIDLIASKRSPNSAPAGAPRCNLSQVGNTIRCVNRTSSGARESSYHFGCKLVDLPANGSSSITIDGRTTYVPWSTFDVRASDFVVNYSDVWNLTGSSLTFDEASCDKVNGQAGWLVPTGAPPDVAVWAVWQLPFDDPYVQLQSAEGEPLGEPIYVPFDAGPCIPAGLGVEASGMKRCQPRSGPVPATEVDLHLFWWRSHMGHESTPAVIDLDTEGVGDEIRIEMEPAEGERFVMRAGEEAMGTLRLCSADVEDACIAPRLPEGTTATVRAVFRHADSGEELFHQEVQFIEDTEPPLARGLRVETTEGGLSLALTAADRTAGVAHVQAVYSTDGGRTWNRRSFETGADLMAGEAEEAAFELDLPLTAEEREGEVQWYVVIQDGVFNLTYVSPPGS